MQAETQMLSEELNVMIVNLKVLNIPDRMLDGKYDDIRKWRTANGRQVVEETMF
jgi:hypothetical protein